MGSNLDIIRATYEGPSEQNGKNLIAALAPDAVWVEAEGFPYAGTYTGPESIIDNVFRRPQPQKAEPPALVHDRSPQSKRSDA
jgi:uncharacterized protein